MGRHPDLRRRDDTSLPKGRSPLPPFGLLQPVTPEDVVFSWEFVTDPKTQEPYSGEMYRTRFEKPEIVDERTVKVCKRAALE